MATLNVKVVYWRSSKIRKRQEAPQYAEDLQRRLFFKSKIKNYKSQLPQPV